MNKAIIASKVGMTQIFDEKGNLIPVTVLQAGPCKVVQIKNKDKEGYQAVQLSFKETKPSKMNKPQLGHFAKAEVPCSKILKEFRFNDVSAYTLGQELSADLFNVGERVDVTGISKGKGFQGNIKRHGFGRGPSSHGSKYHRGVGALSAGSTPARVHKGRKLPGQMGAVKVTVQNLEIVETNSELNYILVKGAVPGPKGSIVCVKDSVKA